MIALPPTRCQYSYTPWRSRCQCGDCEVALERYNEAKERP